MEKVKKKGIKQIVNFLAIMLILCLSIPVSAEMFSAGESQAAADVFVSEEPAGGMDVSGDIFGTNAEFEDVLVPSEEAETPVEDSVMNEISSETEGTAALPGAEGTAVAVVFKNKDGVVYPGLQMNVRMGETIVLPVAPGRENAVGDGWKTELGAAGEEPVIWEAGSQLMISDMNFQLQNKIVDNVLTLCEVPGIDPCVVTYYTADGSRILEQKEVKSGSLITFPDFAESGYKNRGWALQANAAAASYEIGTSYTVKQSTNFFLVRVKMVKASFYSKNGKTSTYYKGLGKTVEQGTTIILPEPKVTLGYNTVGWALKKGATTAVYKTGQTVVLTEDTSFYAIHQYVGKATVKFNNNSGTSTSKTYTAMNLTVTKGTYITLPSLPKASGYINVGWTTVKKGTKALYKAGDKVKITKNMKFYTVRTKSYKVYLYSKTGKLLKTTEVAKNSYYKLPGARNKNGYTMMGWSTKKNQTKNPTYEVGESIKVTKTIKLYSVLYVRSKEKDYSALELDKLSKDLLKNYKKVIFVGDSRTVRMEKTLKLAGYSPSSYNISFIAKSGKGLEWFKETGYQQLLSSVGKSTSKLGKPTAVIFNLGVNDLGNCSDYISYMKSIAPTLTERGCELYYMSVNPVNNLLCKDNGKKNRPEEKIRAFNASIKAQLCGKKGSYTYIDLYSYLLKYGYGTDGGTDGYDTGVDDGLHYTTKTYKRIFRICVNTLNK